MKRYRPAKIILVSLIALVIIAGLVAVIYPITIKWMAGSARLIGRPTNATVFTDGEINKTISVFHIKKDWNGTLADYFILHFPHNEKKSLDFLCINRKHSYAGAPVAAGNRDYDIIGGLLFQSETGSYFTPLQDSIKGFGTSYELTFIDNQIILKMTSDSRNTVSYDSVSVIL